jgi:hypothetical protein
MSRRAFVLQSASSLSDCPSLRSASDREKSLADQQRKSFFKLALSHWMCVWNGRLAYAVAKWRENCCHHIACPGVMELEM